MRALGLGEAMMFTHLAVGVDGSQNGGAAADLAFELGRRLDSVVHGLHVVDSTLLESSWITDLTGAAGLEPLVHLTPQVESVLDEISSSVRELFCESGRKAGATIDFRALRGSVAPTLVEATEPFDLLLVGKRGLNAPYHGDLLGPTTERLLRLSHIPVVVVPETATAPDRLLLGYDGSSKANGAMRLCGELARQLAVPVTVVTAVRSGGDGDALLREATTYFEPFGLDVDAHAAEGNPEEVLAAAVDDPGTTVCLGSHGHGRILELVLGSTTDYLARTLPVPVICVP